VVAERSAIEPFPGRRAPRDARSPASTPRGPHPGPQLPCPATMSGPTIGTLYKHGVVQQP